MSQKYSLLFWNVYYKCALGLKRVKISCFQREVTALTTVQSLEQPFFFHCDITIALPIPCRHVRCHGITNISHHSNCTFVITTKGKVLWNDAKIRFWIIFFYFIIKVTGSRVKSTSSVICSSRSITYCIEAREKCRWRHCTFLCGHVIMIFSFINLTHSHNIMKQ